MLVLTLLSSLYHSICLSALIYFIFEYSRSMLNRIILAEGNHRLNLSPRPSSIAYIVVLYPSFVFSSLALNRLQFEPGTSSYLGSKLPWRATSTRFTPPRKLLNNSTFHHEAGRKSRYSDYLYHHKIVWESDHVCTHRSVKHKLDCIKPRQEARISMNACIYVKLPKFLLITDLNGYWSWE
jgi:hypothetical protein